MGYHTTDRRALLRAGVAVATVGVAGCSELDSVVDGGETESGEPLDLREIRMGETRKGHIDEGDEQDPVYDDLAEPVSFEAESGQRVGVGMQAETFDPYVVLTDEEGNTVGEDDDGGEGDNSRLETTLEEGGTYTVWAGSFSGDATGDYRLSLEEADTETSDGSDLREIAFGQTREGRIDSNDPTDPVRNELAEPVSFEGSADQAVVISMRSEQVDPYLVLTDSDGNLVAQNDDANGLDSRINAVLPEDGTYTIWAGGFETAATGRYSLSLEEGTAPETTDLREIDFGQTREGYIDSQDGRDPRYEDLAEPVSFEASSGTRVRITMESNAIDPFVVLADGEGTVVAENDDGPSGLDSRLETTLERGGTYTIWAGSFSGGATGPYTLTLERA